jgi:hypothetical protein
MTETILAIYCIGVFITAMTSVFTEDAKYFFLSPIWPIVYIKYCWEMLR